MKPGRSAPVALRAGGMPATLRRNAATQVSQGDGARSGVGEGLQSTLIVLNSRHPMGDAPSWVYTANTRTLPPRAATRKGHVTDGRTDRREAASAATATGAGSW